MKNIRIAGKKNRWEKKQNRLIPNKHLAIVVVDALWPWCWVVYTPQARIHCLQSVLQYLALFTYK